MLSDRPKKNVKPTRSERGGRSKDPEVTRLRLVECAFQEIYEHGYAGASLDRILAKTGVTKGALYHHFASKAELTHAVIEEVIRSMIVEGWLGPMRQAADPLQALIDTTASSFVKQPRQRIEAGCPLNNLNQELSNTDEEFRQHLNQLYDTWRAGIAAGLQRGQELGTVRPDVDPSATAAFFVSVIQGMAGTVKSSRDPALGAAVGRTLLQFLETLRPRAAAASARPGSGSHQADH